MIKKYNLLLCELFYEPIHGKTEESDANIDGHYILISKFNPYTNNISYHEDNENDMNANNLNQNLEPYSVIKMITGVYYRKYKFLLENTNIFNEFPHIVIQNYKKIVSKKNYVRPEIGYCILLSSGETIVILKTFWIRLIQRTWKNIFQKRKQIISNPFFIMNMQINYHSFKKIPTIRGMLRL
jgi:hypothetical protein